MIGNETHREIFNWCAKNQADGKTWFDLHYSFELEATKLAFKFAEFLLDPNSDDMSKELKQEIDVFRKRYRAFVDLWTGKVFVGEVHSTILPGGPSWGEVK